VRPQRQPVAADADRLAGDARRLAGREEGDKTRDVTRRAEAELAPRERRQRLAPATASTYYRRAGIVSVMAVAATGTIALTVMFARASSSAQVLTMPTMPALAAA
jgi:hypothetical protein